MHTILFFFSALAKYFIIQFCQEDSSGFLYTRRRGKKRNIEKQANLITPILYVQFTDVLYFLETFTGTL